MRKDEENDEENDEEIVIATTYWCFYRLSSWEIDSEGNVTGVGYVSLSEDDAKNGEAVDFFKGTIAAEDIVSIEAERTNVVGTVFLSLGILALGLAVFVTISLIQHPIGY